jgi:hypothetical protein
VQIVLLLHPQISFAEEFNQVGNKDDVLKSERIGAIDRLLLIEFVKLARFNIQFHQSANAHQRWRTFTYAAGRESGTAVSLGSSLVDLRQRVRGLHDLSLISRGQLKEAVEASLVGNAISGSASGLELAQNTWVMLNARRHGYSPQASTAFVKKIVETSDSLFDQRKRLISAEVQLLERQNRLYELEDLLLHRIRQQLIFEFRAWSCQSRGRAWRENTFYSIDAAQNFTRMAAGVVALKGFSQPWLGGAATISTLIANSAATLNPVICGLAGLSISRYQLRRLSKLFPVDRPNTTDDLVVELELKQRKFSTENQITLLQEASLLADKSERFDVILDRETSDIERLRRVAQQQTIAGPLIGLTSIPAPVLGTIAFYDYRTDRETTNKLLFSGRIPAISGQAFALVQTPYTVISGVIKHNQLKRIGQLPSQLLDERLNNLDRLDKQLRATAR